MYGADPSTKGFTTKLASWDQKGFLAGQDPDRPGLEMGAPMWQVLLNESARDPKTAGEESALFDAFRTTIDIGSMTPRERTAYSNWLMDPAVVSHVDSRGFTQGQQFQDL